MDNSNLYQSGYVVVTDFVAADGSCDVSDALQKVIYDHPNKTIYFPDGVYKLSKPILTPADPKKSVALRLSNYAVIQAAGDWNGDGALIRLGASHFANDIRTIGSNYSLIGGIIDGSGVADGISIDGGRETMVRDVSIKHARIGLHIKKGANNGSSDADIYGVNVIGTGKTDSIGILVEGYDNTISNMRIADVQYGVILRSCGNMLRSIHPLYTCEYEDYENSCGFWDHNGNNWFDFCYADHFGIGFRTAQGIHSIYHNCFCFWYAPEGGSHTVFRADGRFDSFVTNLKVGFHNEFKNNIVLSEQMPGGKGMFERLCVNTPQIITNTHEPYLRGGMFSPGEQDG